MDMRQGPTKQRQCSHMLLVFPMHVVNGNQTKMSDLHALGCPNG